MSYRLPVWHRTMVMLVCIIGLFWALTLGGEPHTWTAAFLFASSGALVAHCLLKHIDRLGGQVDELREKLTELCEAKDDQPVPTPDEPEAVDGEVEAE